MRRGDEKAASGIERYSSLTSSLLHFLLSERQPGLNSAGGGCAHPNREIYKSIRVLIFIREKKNKSSDKNDA